MNENQPLLQDNRVVNAVQRNDLISGSVETTTIPQTDVEFHLSKGRELGFDVTVIAQPGQRYLERFSRTENSDIISGPSGNVIGVTVTLVGDTIELPVRDNQVAIAVKKPANFSDHSLYWKAVSKNSG